MCRALFQSWWAFCVLLDSVWFGHSWPRRTNITSVDLTPTPLMTIMCPVEHFTQAALTARISQIHSCGKNSAVTMSPGTSKAIRKTITAVSRARRPAKQERGSGASKRRSKEIEKEKANREGRVRAFSSKSPHNSRQTHGKVSLWSPLQRPPAAPSS